MKRTLLYAFIIFFSSLFSPETFAQVIDGIPMGLTNIIFTDSMTNYVADTASVPLWQIGHSHKTFFGIDTVGVNHIMTDTVNSYPINANNWFVIKVPYGFDMIVDFWHKFQTDSGHAGGIVEFSLDSGITWNNVKGYCDGTGGGSWSGGILTDNFYSDTDTLISGEPAFMGTSDSLIYSRLQFFEGLPLRTTSGASCDFEVPVIYLRFRFLSDSVTDSLAGWMIDSMQIEVDYYGGSVKMVSKQTLKVYPNPSADGVFNFPVLFDEDRYNTTVYDAMGKLLATTPYTHTLDIGGYSKGVYFYKVSNGVDYYMGQLVVE